MKALKNQGNAAALNLVYFFCKSYKTFYFVVSCCMVMSL